MTAKYKTIAIHTVDLIKLCRHANMTMREVARQANIAESNFSKYAHGYRIMNEETWNKIKKVLDNEKYKTTN